LILRNPHEITMTDLSNLTKVYYTIGEVSDILGAAPSQLRYWESEFTQLRPAKNNRGERKFTKKEIEIADQILFLLKERGFTVEGAKKELQGYNTQKKEKESVIKTLYSLKKRLEDFKKTM
jgi:DNA-binding transcriptional MerR regulator